MVRLGAPVSSEPGLVFEAVFRVADGANIASREHTGEGNRAHSHDSDGNRCTLEKGVGRGRLAQLNDVEITRLRGDGVAQRRSAARTRSAGGAGVGCGRTLTDRMRSPREPEKSPRATSAFS